MNSKTIELYKKDNKTVLDAYSMLVTNIHLGNGKEVLKTIALPSCRPGEGKTSLAINLAITMAGSGWKVLFVDGDMRKPNSAKRLESIFVSGLSDFLAGKAEIDEVIYRSNIPNLSYLPSGRHYEDPIALLCSERFGSFLSDIRNDYDFVLFDTPALTSVVDGALIASKVDGTLIVTEMGLTTLTSLKRIKSQLEKLDANVLGVVLNKVKKHYYRQYFGSYNYFINSKRFNGSKKDKSKKIADDTNAQSGIGA